MQTFGWPEAYFILRSARWTLLLTAIASSSAALIGGVFAIMRAVARQAPLRRFAAGYILVIQSIPVLMVLFMSYYGLSALGHRTAALLRGLGLAGDLCQRLSRRDLARLDRAVPRRNGRPRPRWR